MVRYILLCMLLSSSVALAEDIRMGFGINGIYIGMPFEELETLYPYGGQICTEKEGERTIKCSFKEIVIARTACGGEVVLVKWFDPLNPAKRYSPGNIFVYDLSFKCDDPNGHLRQGLEGIFGPEYTWGIVPPENGKWAGWRLPNKIVVGFRTDEVTTEIRISDRLTYKWIQDSK